MKLFSIGFLVSFLISLSFADVGSNAFVQSYIATCEAESGNRDFCSCMANEVLNSLNNKEKSLLSASSITPDIAKDIENLQLKVMRLSLDEEKLKYCLGD